MEESYKVVIKKSKDNEEDFLKNVSKERAIETVLYCRNDGIPAFMESEKTI